MEEKMTTQEFRQHVADAQQRAAQAPVFITENGEYNQVLMSYQEYLRLTEPVVTLAESLGFSDAADVDFELPVRQAGLHRYGEI